MADRDLRNSRHFLPVKATAHDGGPDHSERDPTANSCAPPFIVTRSIPAAVLVAVALESAPANEASLDDDRFIKSCAGQAAGRS